MDAPANSSRRPNNWKKNPDPASEPELARQRERQWRRISINPFQPQEGSNENALGQKPNSRRTFSSGSGNAMVKDEGISDFAQPPEHEIKHPKLKDLGSSWVHLFNDLAWAASFASLTGGERFDNPLVTIYNLG
ncbi:hypothetical protein RSOL_215330, partial [Rhizoctonia solani AG-3 Rhs1AP]